MASNQNNRDEIDLPVPYAPSAPRARAAPRSSLLDQVVPIYDPNRRVTPEGPAAQRPLSPLYAEATAAHVSSCDSNDSVESIVFDNEPYVASWKVKASTNSMALNEQSTSSRAVDMQRPRSVMLSDPFECNIVQRISDPALNSARSSARSSTHSSERYGPSCRPKIKENTFMCDAPFDNAAPAPTSSTPGQRASFVGADVVGRQLMGGTPATSSPTVATPAKTPAVVGSDVVQYRLTEEKVTTASGPAVAASAMPTTASFSKVHRILMEEMKENPSIKSPKNDVKAAWEKSAPPTSVGSGASLAQRTEAKSVVRTEAKNVVSVVSHPFGVPDEEEAIPIVMKQESPKDKAIPKPPVVKTSVGPLVEDKDLGTDKSEEDSVEVISNTSSEDSLEIPTLPTKVYKYKTEGKHKKPKTGGFFKRIRRHISGFFRKHCGAMNKVDILEE